MYLKDRQDLSNVLSEAPSSAVILNKTQVDSNSQALPMSHVLRHVLTGDTHSFTALVGFFGHRGAATGEDRTLTDIIVDEARESLKDGQQFEETAFRLAVGTNSSLASQQASRAWYWLCRYRHEAPDGIQRADAFREAFLQHAHDTSFEQAVGRLLQPFLREDEVPDEYGDSPFRQKPSQFVEELDVRFEEGGPQELEALYEKTMAPKGGPPIRRTAQTLLGFFLQRKASLRINPKKRSNGVTTVFHPKVYVVERGETASESQTVSVVGSHNWTQSALGLTEEASVISNVEVATLHADEGHLWENGTPESAERTLGSRVCATAHHLFEESDYVLGAWTSPAGDQLLPAHRLEDTTKHVSHVPDNLTSEDKPGYTPDPSEQSPSKAIRELAPHLQGLAERLIGLGSFRSSAWKQYQSFFEDESRTTFGYTPAPYQSDAALRLMSMLGPNPRPPNQVSHSEYRGAFLTDETGLGKTIVGQMVSTILLVERLQERTLYERDIPLRASFIVPARLTGDEKRASGWAGHRMDVERAVRRLLEQKPSLNGRSVEELMNLLDLRVFSLGEFSRRLFDVEDVTDYGPGEEDSFADIAVKDRIAEDFFHIALSEVILIDESHNFRNDTSRRTRTLRFLSSLPLPGEDWAFRIFDSNEESPDTADDGVTRRPAIQRRMLCLSATPFNNDVSDLVTQMGHFGQYQDWTQAYNASLEVPNELGKSLREWKHATAGVDPDDLKPHFGTLLRHAARHLESSRSLSVREDKIERGAEDERAVTSDRGPRYEWRAENYVDVLRSVQQWAQERSDHPEDESQLSARKRREKKEAQERMDSLLVDLFVQRSRARILRMAQSSRGAELGTMFRHPRVPRYPIALNEGPEEGDEQEASSDFEREVLGGLYRLLGKADEDIGETDTLSFQSYKISVNRSRSGGEGSTRANFLGFQLTGLVKRLQSSPYSFFRTVVRGVLRHALTEFALVEYLVEALNDERYGLPENHLLKRNHADLENALEDVRDILTYDYENTVEELHGVMGGTLQAPDSTTFFRSLTGCNSEAERNERPRVKDFKTAVDRTEELLGDGQLELEGTEAGWLKDLIDDVSAAPGEDDNVSLLWKDIQTVLDWVEDGVERDAEGLRKQLYKYIEKEEVGFAMGDVRRLCVELVNEAPDSFQSRFKALRNVTRWANHRLENDPRLRSLTAWLLIQARARLESSQDIPTDLLRSGSRTLLFTEYTDTQEYIIAVLAALNAAYLPFTEPYAIDEKHHRRLQREVEDLTERLTSEIQRMSTRLSDWTTAVTSQASDHDDSRDPFAKASLYSDPIVREGTSGEESTPDWLQSFVEEGVEHMAETVTEMGHHVGRICSGTNNTDTAHFLFPEGDTASGPVSDTDEVTEGGDDPEAFNAVAEHEIVDAFSPWYQIEPRDQYQITDDDTTDDTDSLREDCQRFRAISDRPVETLVATRVLAEGVNLQECGVVVHYDLPWNPTRLIQRNGRVDRRINPTYEEPDRREELLDNMLGAVETVNQKSGTDISFDDDDVPVFHKPKQIYHMTVVPPEPELEDVDDDTLIRRVRQRIFQKLETIRALFGLSTWPVVLDRTAARRVLSGELDYETPGFRRREELFAAWARLRELTAETDEDTDAQDSSSPQSFFLKVPARFVERLGNAVGGQGESEEEERLHQWADHFQGAAVLQSSRYHETTVPVRSIAEHNGLTEKEGVINGVVLVSTEEADLEDSGVSVWGIRPVMGEGGKKQDQFVPYLAESTGEKWEFDVSHLNLTTLDTTREEPPSPDAGAPVSPAATAEDILVELVSLALDDEEPIQIATRCDDLGEEESALAERLSLFQKNPWFTERLFRAQDDWEADTELMYLNGDPLDEEPSTRPPNLWLLVADGDLSDESSQRSNSSPHYSTT